MPCAETAECIINNIKIILKIEIKKYSLKNKN